ncbi:MAG: hypothetical protein ABSG83_07315 [Roseiarcus sp.]|jgi:hypothetical protein
MNIVHGGRMEFAERNNPRGGTFRYKRLVEGASGTPGNFGLMLSRTYENFVSPRHRHNFEQFRFQLEGVSDFGRDGAMAPGTLGYFPEGAFYGPQSASGPALVLVLQFGGPSGSGYMSEDDLQRSVAQLSRQGEFRAGVFHRAEGQPGRARQDAYEAAWEHHNGRVLAYPEPLTPAPVLVADADLPWRDLAPGVEVKNFGAFEGGAAASLLRLEPGAAQELDGPAVAFVVAGAGTIGGEAVAEQASLEIESGAAARFCAETATTLLLMQLPRIAARKKSATIAA